MKYIDFHTHHVPLSTDVVAVVDGCDTWGIHPWKADESFVVPNIKDKLAIGECGLDALRGPSIEIQQQVFCQQIALSEELGKPLIIHCVKALDQLLRLRKELHPSMPWMFHGFTGKPQQLHSLLAAGFYISFGFHHNKESLSQCPLERLILESDDELRSVEILYKEVAKVRGINMPSLCAAMEKNYLAFFQKGTTSDIKHH